MIHPTNVSIKNFWFAEDDSFDNLFCFDPWSRFVTVQKIRRMQTGLASIDTQFHISPKLQALSLPSGWTSETIQM